MNPHTLPVITEEHTFKAAHTRAALAPSRHGAVRVLHVVNVVRLRSNKVPLFGFARRKVLHLDLHLPNISGSANRQGRQRSPCTPYGLSLTRPVGLRIDHLNLS